jgi:hypothetical protein
MLVYLVYQGGIANLFRVDQHTLQPDGRNAKRILQSDFRTCQDYARGMRYAGAIVKTAGCNRAGDIVNLEWTDDLGSLPFSELLYRVES